jgi:hypothetical protein
MRMVRIYQKQMQFTLQDLYEEVLKSKGFNDLQLEIIFPAPDSQQEIKIVDTIVRRMMIINQMIATLGISPPNSWIVNYVFKDLTQFESKELINLLEFEEQKQRDTAEGEEYPSLFEEDDWGNSAATDNNENIDTFEQTNISSNILQQMLQNDSLPVLEKTNSDNKAKNINDAIKLGLEYLKIQKNISGSKEE